MDRTRVTDPDTQVEYDVPTYSTAEETLKREKSIRLGALRTIRMPSSGSLSALGDADGSPLDLETLPLSQTLISRLNAWVRSMDVPMIAAGVMPVGVREDWEMRGEQLFDEVAEQLWSTARVVRRFGELSA